MDRVYIAAGEWLAPGPAASWRRMREAGMPAGGITEAGRTYERQQYLYGEYLAGRLVATAAKPGTSRHETGYAIDIQTSSATQEWLVAHGGEHGWSRPLLHATKPEPWHWEYVASSDQHLTPDAPTFTPPMLSEEEDDMKDLIEACYRVISLYEPTDDEVASVQVTTAGLTRKEIVTWFWAQRATAKTVTALYQAHIGRLPDAGGLASWTALSNRQAHDGIANSAEAKARR